ncbi:MAG TPA: DNA polymerase subunit beta [Archaeoglobaceae archaeon]|nr:DNA polymerase subunit beta [Archaeoglobaceae archaeon]
MRESVNKPIRLRDFIRVGDFYFSVIGYRNEKGIKCFLRYVPDKKGEREKEGKKFKKLLHRDAIEFAKRKSLRYFNGRIFIVPGEDVDEIFKPEERLDVEGEIGKIVNFFSGIPLSEMGVTGSRLIGLMAGDSDIDFVMYGKWWFRGREKIMNGIRSGRISEPDKEMWDFIFKKKKVNIPYSIFLSQERRKYHRAVVGSVYFDLLYVRGYGELKKDVPEEEGVKAGITEVKAELMNDVLIFDYPAYYPLKHKEIEAVLSFTHTYAGQAFKGEVIEAEGVVEIINERKYLIVGTEREVEDEYIVSLTHLEKKGLIKEFLDWKRR